MQKKNREAETCKNCSQNNDDKGWLKNQTAQEALGHLKKFQGEADK